MTRVRALSIAVALTAALLVSACSGSGDGSSDGSPAGSPSGSSAPQSVPAVSAAPAPAALAPGRSVTDGYGDTVTLAPVTMNRRGNLLLFELSATVTRAKNANANLSLLFVHDKLDWQVSLVDPVHGKRYLPATDSKGDCLCTNFTGGLTVEQGQTGVLTAWFAAPPADVKSLDVDVPGLATFTAVPVSG